MVEARTGLRRMGVLYMFYRVIVALIILFAYIFDSVGDFGLYANYYLMVVISYFGLTLYALGEVVIRRNVPVKLPVHGWLDICFFGLFNYIFGQVGAHVGLLFVVTIFILGLVQERRVTLLLTLAAIIFVNYSAFFDSWIDSDQTYGFVNSFILTVLFLVVSALGINFASRFKTLELINRRQIAEIGIFQGLSLHIMDQIETGYLVVNDQMSLLMMNPSAQRMFGIQQFKSMPLDRLSAELNNLLMSNKSLGLMDFSFKLSVAGRNLYVSYKGLKSDEYSGLGVVSIEDIDEIAQHVKYLNLASLGQLSASIAHEVRNPLASIKQASTLIVGATEEKTERYCKMIQNQCARIDTIVESTLGMARVGGFNPVSIGVKQELESILADDFIDHNQVRLNIDQNIKVLFDGDHFRQVFINLINNAMRHNNRDVSEYVEINAALDGDWVVIDVIDYGSGVEDAAVINLFKPFFTTAVDGTGLGLHLSKNLCETNRAKIEYIKIGLGACFRVYCRRLYTTG